MVTSSLTWGAYLPALKSLRFTVTLALAPMACLGTIGCCMAVNELRLRVTGRVTPLMVSSPSTATGLSPSNTTRVDLKVAVGYCAVWKKSSPWMCSLKVAKPVSTERMSISMSTEPVRASWSSTTVPVVVLKRLIWVDSPKWL